MSISSRILESIVGALVVCVAVCFFYYAYTSRSWDDSNAYVIHARFDKADGLLIGSDVKISGIKVGSVTRLALDPQTYQALVTFQLTSDVKLPTDTSAEIASDGLLGGKHLRLIVGNSDVFFQSQGTIEYTQSSVSLESLIGQLIFSQKKGGEEHSSKEGATP